MVVAFIDFSAQLLQGIVGMLLSILLLSSALNKFNQPYFVAYILAGILLGPHGLKLFSDVQTVASIGSLGLIIQMFFIGAEIEVPSLLKNSRMLIVGTIMQLLLSFIFIQIIGIRLEWSSARIILFSFIISLSSSAIILDYLHKNKEINTRLGTITTGILLSQDFLFVPMLMTLNFISNGESNWVQLILGLIVTMFFTLLLRKIILKKQINFNVIKVLSRWKPDHEMQVFMGLLICFGFSWITSLLHLSSAMGAMFAGMIIAQNKSTRWLNQSLIPFRVFFLALFFFSIGLQINLNFIGSHFFLVFILALAVLVINSGINALVFKILNEDWKKSVYAGALLSQIGEFSLVLCTVARTLDIVDDFSFQLTLAVISLTMLFSLGWINIVRTFLFDQS